MVVISPDTQSWTDGEILMITLMQAWGVSFFLYYWPSVNLSAASTNRASWWFPNLNWTIKGTGLLPSGPWRLKGTLTCFYCVQTVLSGRPPKYWWLESSVEKPQSQASFCQLNHCTSFFYSCVHRAASAWQAVNFYKQSQNKLLMKQTLV